MYLTHSERNRFVMAAGVALAACIGLVAGMAAPIPESLSMPLYQLAVTVDGQTHIADYNMTLSDCVTLWDDYPPVGFGLACERMAGSR